MNKTTIAVIGLGKLGLPLALSFAAGGYRVIGYDINASLMEKLRSGTCPYVEPGTREALSRYRRRLVFADSPEELVRESSLVFIVVPTPSVPDGSFSSAYVEEALLALAPFVTKKKTKFTAVVTSTVSPGTTQSVLKPLLEKATGKQVGKGLGLCYSPELIALGSVLRNISRPDFLFIGESDGKTGRMVARVRKSICKNNPRIIRTNWINVELAKLALNAYVTTKISFANMVARIAEHTEGADSDVILGTIGQDSRIGTKYLKGGLGFGGPCFPRDNLSFYAAIQKAGLDIDLPLKTHEFNREQVKLLAGIIRRYRRGSQTVGILGLSYKPDTDVVEESQGMLLAGTLLDEGVKVIVHDPQAAQAARKALSQALFASNAHGCIARADVVVLATPWESYRNIDWGQYSRKIVIDCWRAVGRQGGRENVFIQLGKYLP